MDIDLSHYRKLMVLLVTAAIMYTLHSYGIAAASLAQFGLDVPGIAGTVVDFLLVVGIPAVFNMAQPNETGQSLWRDWWHWIAIGLLGIVVLVAAVVLLAGAA